MLRSAMMRLFTLFVISGISLITTSCKSRPYTIDSTPAFADLYFAAKPDTFETHFQNPQEQTLSISARNMPMLDFIQWLTNKSEISVICSENLDLSSVSIDVVDEPLSDILSTLARRLGVEITKQGNIYYFGELKATDRGLLVRKARRLDQANIQQALNVLQSDIGRSAVFADGVIVIGDRVRVLQNIDSMITQIENADAASWVIQYYLINVHNSFSRTLGIETETGLQIAATFGAAGGMNYELNAAFNAILHAARNSSQAQIIAQPLMLLTDGSEASFEDTTNIPIPKRNVSPEGTVTTVGFENRESGLIVNTSIREYTDSDVKITSEIRLNSITGYVENAPIIMGQHFKNESIIKSAGIYLIGSLESTSHTDNQSGSFFNTLFEKRKRHATTQIWVRAYRIQKGGVQ